MLSASASSRTVGGRYEKMLETKRQELRPGDYPGGIFESVHNPRRTRRPSDGGIKPGEEDLLHNVHRIERSYAAIFLADNTVSCSVAFCSLRSRSLSPIPLLFPFRSRSASSSSRRKAPTVL